MAQNTTGLNGNGDLYTYISIHIFVSIYINKLGSGRNSFGIRIMPRLSTGVCWFKFTYGLSFVRLTVKRRVHCLLKGLDPSTALVIVDHLTIVIKETQIACC